MIITFQELIGLLPLLILCITILCVLFLILLKRNYCITFFVTIIGISISCLSLYLVCINRIYQITSLFYIDRFSILCMVLVLIASLISSMVAYMWLSCNCSLYRDEFYLLLLIVTTGGILVINASHLVMLFFGIELVSLPLCGLIGYVTGRKYALETTIKYILLSGISTAFLLFGIALVYAEIGCLSFVNLSDELITRTTVLSESMLLIVGISMMLVGFGFKLSLVPFHLWTADVYQGSSEIAGMCLATINKISIFSGLTHFFLLFPESYNKVTYILTLISCASMLFGSLMAIQEENVKRILGYSSITYMGYLLVGILGSIKRSSIYSYNVLNMFKDGIEVISICLVNYVFATLGAFSILSLIWYICYYSNNGAKEDIGVLNSYRGLFWKNPILSIMFTIMILSFAGIPATLGFIAKFYLVAFSMERELWWCIVFIIFSSGVSVLYYFRVVIALYLSPLSKNFNARLNNIYDIMRYHYNNRLIMISSFIFSICISSILLLFFGIFPQYLLCLFSLI